MKWKRILAAIGAAGILLALILDNQTVIHTARDAITLLLHTVIPTLFPFLFLIPIVVSSIPCNGFTFLLSGFLGGYPIGARCVEQAVSNGALSPVEGSRMIIYCNAAGPAFIFGMLSQNFSSGWHVLLLWLVHIASALITARVLNSFPRQISNDVPLNQSLTERLRNSIRTMSEICGWILLMRILIELLKKWVLWVLPGISHIWVSGIMELSNGCLYVSEIDGYGLRFLMCAFFVSFGGLCVWLQTLSCAPHVNTYLYIPGKLLEGMIAILIAYPIQRFLFHPEQRINFSLWTWLFIAIISIYLYFCIKKKNKSRIMDCVGV